MELIRYTSEDVEEWSALYVDGKLDRVGDSYLIDERIAELAKVVEREGNFLLGGSRYEDAANTVEEIEDYETRRASELQYAADLEAQAKVLEAQAAEIRARKTLT